MRRWTRRIIRLAAVLLGLYGGWLAAGAMNNNRIELTPTHPQPTTLPTGELLHDIH